MNIYPIVTTPEPARCKDFYVKLLGAKVLFEAEWYVQLSFAHWEIGFLKPNPPQRLPVFAHAQPSRGLTFAVEVEDVKALYKKVVASGIDPLGKPSRFPNGEIAFSVVDPAGIVLNIVEFRPDQSQVIEL